MALLALLFCSGVSLQIGRLDTDRRLSEARSQVTNSLALHRARLEGVVTALFSINQGMSEVITYQGGIDADLFNALARQIITKYPQIRNISLARDNIITLLYPLEGNRQALGFDYRTNPEQYGDVAKAERTGLPIFSGPFHLVQGGRALIARMPVFTLAGVAAGGQPRYWGMVSVVINIDRLIHTSGLDTAGNLTIGLRKIEEAGRPGELIWGEGRVFARSPVSMEVVLPGNSWEIAALPREGWPLVTAAHSPLFYIGLINSLLVAAMVWWLVARPYRVRLRNQALQKEILERIRVEEEMRLSERKYASIFHLMPDMVGITRLSDGTFLEINEGFTRITGWHKDEILGRTSIETGLWSPEARAGAMEIVRERGRLENYEFELTNRSGTRRRCLMFLVPITVKGEPCLYFMARDITELKETQSFLENERTRLRNLLQTIPAMVWMKDTDGVYLFCNARFERFFGASETEIIGRSDFDFIDREQAEFFREHDRRAIAAGCSCVNEEWITYADDGHRELLETIKTPVHDAAGQLLGVLGVAWDITGKKRTEEELRNERTRYINLVDSVDGVVWETDARSLRFTYVSGQGERLLGYSPDQWHQERFWQEHLHPEDRERILALTEARTAAGEDHELEYRFLARDGRVFWIQDIVTVVLENGVPGWRRGIMVDITGRTVQEKEKQNLEAQLRQAQKMEAIGRLAGGVAHDFNNKLSVILGYADLLKEGRAGLEKSRDYVTQIIRAATQSRDITRQLLAFSRQEEISPQVLDLNTLVRSVRKGLGRFISEDILFELRLAPDLWRISMDPTQVDQVLMNLIVNARDAMSGGGRLVVTTENVTIDPLLHRQHPELREGDFVRLTVEDSGSGISEETLPHIFEPFYTTKGTGQGTGLGLATVYGIVSQNQGVVLVDSTQGLGSTFSVYFPRCMVEEQGAETVEEPLTAGGRATILMVEDEETVRQMTTDMLAASGYTTLVAGTPEEALELCAEYNGAIDLLLTDVIMPGMNGKELSEEILAMRPDIRVLYMSGYAADIVSAKGLVDTSRSFIQKPFSLRTLVERIEERLNAKSREN